MFSMIRRLTGAGLAMIALVLVPAAAQADDAAEAFVERNGDMIMSILGDDSLSIEQQAARFRELVDDLADVDRVARFVLGRYSRSVAADDYRQFSDAFREYAISVYESRLSEYAGERIEVLGSTDRRGAEDVIVHTRIAGGERNDTIEVNWRVLGGPDNHHVVDVEILGVWLAVNQREEIVSIIGANGGRVSAATDALRARAVGS